MLTELQGPVDVNTDPDDYCILIISYGRPNSVATISSLARCGSTKPWFLVVDDQDPTVPDYIKRFGEDRVVVFSKAEIAARMDCGDNIGDWRTSFFARNAVFDIAERLGYRWFIQFDDDYTDFRFRFDDEHRYWTKRRIINLDAVTDAMMRYYRSTPFASICMAQGGDFIGGGASTYGKQIRTQRKAMNSFFLCTDRRFEFPGRINEDVNIYTELQHRDGLPFLTIFQVALIQLPTQSAVGGMTDIYLDRGTYVKSFYSVMRCPSAVKIYKIGHVNPRIHHLVRYKNCAPQIVREEVRKP